ncbi:hypothetical protein BDP81DRAFT_430777 [Colletotrichum phormii]|uniref:Uncharacterized protein n=1 Tax=Colletotrichum phormii TaxID=359342 RepID=A0AAI9ZQZ3_9PEZI|nr:uncharacterized protein BDP81DRAFT_430777 [Colletotrichum phormii]KAK1635087.1 hypothetical protein BDP81DRAFT_430777 [Colletotrichum phormii]
MNSASPQDAGCHSSSPPTLAHLTVKTKPVDEAALINPTIPQVGTLNEACGNSSMEGVKKKKKKDSLLHPTQSFEAMVASFNFLALPRELRDMVYMNYLAVDGGYVCDSQAFIDGKLRAGKHGGPIELNLIYACKQMAQETNGMALRVNQITFSTITSEGLRILASRFESLIARVDQKRNTIFRTAGHCISDEAYDELKGRYPHFIPVLDRLRAEQGQFDTVPRHGSFGEATSVYREFCKDTPRAASLCNPNAARILQRWGDFGTSLRMIDLSIPHWTIPTEDELNQLLASVGENPYHVIGLERGGDLSIYRFSAASAAIYFLTSVPAAVRAQVRRIVLDEDREAVAAPECHGLGLIPFCQENPLLHVERRVNLWRNVLQANTMTPYDRINPEVRGTATARLLYSKDVTGLVAKWVSEARAIVSAGMPAESFSLILDGEPAAQHASGIFQTVVQRDIAWQLAWIEAQNRQLFSVKSVHQRRGERSAAHSCDGYFYEDFPRAMADIANGDACSSIVQCNFDVGQVWDVERMIHDHRSWSPEKWKTKWPKHEPALWETVPPLPEWMALLEENILGHDEEVRNGLRGPVVWPGVRDHNNRRIQHSLSDNN